MDLKILERITVLEYLKDYSVVSSRRRSLYRQSFSKFDKDRDGYLSIKELHDALADLYIHPELSVCLKEFMEIVNNDQSKKQKEEMNDPVDEKDLMKFLDHLKTNFLTFKGIAALLERMMYVKRHGKMTFVEEINGDQRCQRHPLEQSDFDGLLWKLRGCDVNPNVLEIINCL